MNKTKTFRKTIRRTGRKAIRRTGRKAIRRTGRKAIRRTGRKAIRRTGRKIVRGGEVNSLYSRKEFNDSKAEATGDTKWQFCDEKDNCEVFENDRGDLEALKALVSQYFEETGEIKKGYTVNVV
jgi:hypothetical protein